MNKLVRTNITYFPPYFCGKKRHHRLQAYFHVFVSPFCFHFVFTDKNIMFHRFFTNVFTCLFSGPFLPLHACLSMSVSICLYLSLLVSACLWSPFPSLSVCMSGVGCLCLPVCLPVSLPGLCLHVPILVMFAFFLRRGRSHPRALGTEPAWLFVSGQATRAPS